MANGAEAEALEPRASESEELAEVLKPRAVEKFAEALALLPRQVADVLLAEQLVLVVEVVVVVGVELLERRVATSDVERLVRASVPSALAEMS